MEFTPSFIGSAVFSRNTPTWVLCRNLDQGLQDSMGC